MNKSMMSWLSVFLFVIGSLMAGEARLAYIFQDNMVLQRDKDVPVWGWCDRGVAVEISFSGQKVKTTAGGNGYWKVILKPMPACNNGTELHVSMGEKKVALKNVVVGEVWIAAGQSNMNHSGPNLESGIYPKYDFNAKGGLPDVRITRFGEGASFEPQDDIIPVTPGAVPWKVITSGNEIKDLNIPTGFACLLRDRLNVPVGIIHVAVSGTNQGAWMKREVLEGFPAGGKYKNYYEALLDYKNQGLSKRTDGIKCWDDFVKVYAGWKKDPKGRGPVDLSIQQFPSVLYNTRIHPLGEFALRGVIWHQGEAGPNGPYGERLAAMIKQWREQFSQEFYFIWGTLSRNTGAAPILEPNPSWFYRSDTNCEIRKALDGFGKQGNATLVELYDLGDQGTHFLQKGEAGRRMGLAAMSLVYGDKQSYSGPLKSRVEIKGNKAVVQFTRVGDGLVYKPTIDGISGVYIKGKNGDFKWADLKVTGTDTIEIFHPDVAEISALGYAVFSNPYETLFNSDGLPASPFRVNMEKLPHTGHEGGTKLVEFDKPVASKPTISVVHVRRDGYVFQLIPGRKAPAGEKAFVSGYIPGEWDDFVVESKCQALQVESCEKSGRKFVSFSVPIDTSWIIVARKSKVSEFRKVNRF